MIHIKRNNDGTHTGLPSHVQLGAYRKLPVEVRAVLMPEEFEVETLEGTMHGNRGDYLICGVQGEYYPCKPAIFRATYEEIRRKKKTVARPGY